MKKTKEKSIKKNKKFEIKELDGNYALVMNKPVNLGATVLVTFSDGKSMTTEAVEQNQIVFLLPENLDIVDIEIVEKEEGKTFRVVMTVGKDTYETEHDELVEALLAFPSIKINSKVLFSVYYKEKIVNTSVLFPMQTKRIIANRVAAVLFANKIKVLLK